MVEISEDRGGYKASFQLIESGLVGRGLVKQDSFLS